MAAGALKPWTVSSKMTLPPGAPSFSTSAPANCALAALEQAVIGQNVGIRDDPDPVAALYRLADQHARAGRDNGGERTLGDKLEIVRQRGSDCETIDRQNLAERRRSRPAPHQAAAGPQDRKRPVGAVRRRRDDIPDPARMFVVALAEPFGQDHEHIGGAAEGKAVRLDRRRDLGLGDNKQARLALVGDRSDPLLDNRNTRAAQKLGEAGVTDRRARKGAGADGLRFGRADVEGEEVERQGENRGQGRNPYQQDARRKDAGLAHPCAPLPRAPTNVAKFVRQDRYSLSPAG